MRTLLCKLALLKSQLVVLESEIALLRSNLMSFEMQMHLEKRHEGLRRSGPCEESRWRPRTPGAGLTT